MPVVLVYSILQIIEVEKEVEAVWDSRRGKSNGSGLESWLWLWNNRQVI